MIVDKGHLSSHGDGRSISATPVPWTLTQRATCISGESLPQFGIHRMGSTAECKRRRCVEPDKLLSPQLASCCPHPAFNTKCTQ